MTTGGEVEQRDYAGAIYGSVLAASVVAGTSPGDDYASPAELAILLAATGLVFWLAHVYAELFGGVRQGPDRLSWPNIRAVAANEWPIAGSVVPPTLAALAGMAFGLSDVTTSWLCLVVALAGLTGSAVTAAAAAGVGRHLMGLSALISLSFGGVIIVLKVSLAH
jgi:hypothetical protein